MAPWSRLSREDIFIAFFKPYPVILKGKCLVVMAIFWLYEFQSLSLALPS